MKKIDFEQVKKNFPKREKTAHKGTFGTLACVCGSRGFAGAAVMSAEAAIKSGVGLVNVLLPESIYNVTASFLKEPIFTLLKETKDGTLSVECRKELFLALEKSTVCLIGCGLGNNEDTRTLVFDIIKNYDRPIVIDADGINAVSTNINILRAAKGPVILTPHPGEMARLLKKDVTFVTENRESCAKKFAIENDVIIVLKGYGTIIADKSGDTFINFTGNPGMASAGMGDVLAGMIASFLAQGMSPLNAAISGVYLHGASGDICAEKFSQISMSATDVINELPSLFLKF
ncbi:MAG: Bifunctional NAD(P)H-hydrate repair enzyme Nnr [Eubacteriales bacterium SKADARSKE-1]|nr:Bifunctional NAD(P)H-hydrate repair enzyme Nnr [Eubacteriales bacterium SKADARSKE-1]